MSPIAESPTSTNKLHNETLSFLPTRFRSDIVCGTYYSPCPTMCSWLLGQTKPQAKNTLEEALSSHLDIAIQKSQLRTNSTRASRGTANPESTEFTSKIPCEFIFYKCPTPSTNNISTTMLQYFSLLARIPHKSRKRRIDNALCQHNVNTLTKLLENTNLSDVQETVFQLQKEIHKMSNKLINKSKHLIKRIPQNNINPKLASTLESFKR